MFRRISNLGLVALPALLLVACADSPAPSDDAAASSANAVVIEIPGAPDATMVVRHSDGNLLIELGDQRLQGRLIQSFMPEGLQYQPKFMGELSSAFGSSLSFSGSTGASGGFSGSTGAGSGLSGSTGASGGFSGSTGAARQFSGAAAGGSLAAPACSLQGFCSMMAVTGASSSDISQCRAHIDSVLVPVIFSQIYCAAADLIDCIARNFRRLEYVGPGICGAEMRALAGAGDAVMGMFDDYDDDDDDEYDWGGDWGNDDDDDDDWDWDDDDWDW